MFILSIGLSPIFDNHNSTGLQLHIVLCYVLAAVAVLALPQVRVPHLGAYLIAFWSGLGLLSVYLTIVPESLYHDVCLVCLLN